MQRFRVLAERRADPAWDDWQLFVQGTPVVLAVREYGDAERAAREAMATRLGVTPAEVSVDLVRSWD